MYVSRVKPVVTAEFRDVDAPIDFIGTPIGGIGTYNPMSADGTTNASFTFDNTDPRGL